jgi:hypothetical protein
MQTKIITDVFHGFPHRLQENTGIASRVGHRRFLPNSFQFIISTIRRYVSWIPTASYGDLRSTKEVATSTACFGRMLVIAELQAEYNLVNAILLYILSRLGMIGLDDWICCIFYIYNSGLRVISSADILHTLQFTVTHALGSTSLST